MPNLFIDEGADLVGVARVAIAHSHWASEIEGDGFAPERPPFTPEHLINQGLSPTFVDYMRKMEGLRHRWKNISEVN